MHETFISTHKEVSGLTKTYIKSGIMKMGLLCTKMNREGYYNACNLYYQRLSEKLFGNLGILLNVCTFLTYYVVNTTCI